MSTAMAHPHHNENPDEWGNRPWWRRTDSFMPAILVLGLALPMLAYVFMMVNLGWRDPVFGTGSSVAMGTSSGTLYLYASPASRRYFSGVGGDYEVLLKPWRAYFEDRQADYREIDSLSGIRRAAGSVLVLPSSVALTDGERSQIARYQAQGGSVLATWASGSRDGEGEWLGWSFLQGLGVHVLGEIPAEVEDRQMTIIGESPVTHSLLPGERIWMTRSSEPLLRLRGESSAARFTNWTRATGADRSDEGAVVFAETRTSRTVAFAFSESTWAASPVPTYQLIDDTLAWLYRQPMLALANWPRGHRAAQVLEMDTEQDFANGSRFAEMLATEQLPATFFVLTSEAMRHAAALQEYARHHEIAYHGDVHVSFKGQTTADQSRRIQAMIAQLATLIPDPERPLRGFRAPYEGYDATTERLLQRSGIRYHASDPGRSEGQLPLFVKMDGVAVAEQLLVLPRTQRDDFNLLADASADGRLLPLLLSDLDDTVRYGGMGLLSVHSQSFAPGAPLPTVMSTYLAEVGGRARGGVLWVASAGEINDWWRNRQRFNIHGVLRGQRLELEITVRGDTPVQGAGVIVMLPNRNAIPTIRSAKVGEARPEIRRIDDYRSQFLFESLAPGNYTYQINFTQPSE